MKQFLRYILTLVAIFIATTNIWADCVIFSDGGSYEVMNGLSQRKEKNFTNIPALPAGLLTFTYSASGAAIGGVDVTATYSDGTSATILSSSRVSNPSYNFNGKIVTKLTFKGTSGTLKKTISNVKLTRHTSISASTISPFPLTAVGSTSNAQTVTITYANIGNNYSITSTNTNDFSISPLPFTYDKCGGEMQFAITFHPQGTAGGARSGSFTIAGDGNGKSNNNTSVTINVSGTAKGFPEFTWKGNTQYYVDESLDLSNLWTTTSNETTPKYSIKRFTSTDTFGSADPHFTDATNTTILLSKEGELVLQMHQDASTTYSPLTKEVTITIVKRPTDFSLNFANEYFVDDEINKSTFFTNATNSEVAVQVSDKTADNRALFTYNGSILKANGAILNADAETTTITVTQPETYKWTGKTLPKEVIVKKYPTDFNWLLQNTYYVGETITSIFTKTNNSLPSTITSSDPTIVKVENNQLIALRAGKVRITVSQAVDRKWVAFTHEKEITIIKRNTNFQLILGTTYYVDDRIAKSNIYSKANENPLPISIVSSNPNILEYDATTQQLIARNAGKATITVSQAKDTTWTDFNQSLEVTILKHNIVATINPNNAVWNELVSNPFAATSTHPISGQVTTFQDDDFNVAQQGNEHIALMDANTRNIQTYFNNGTVKFLVSRQEDYKYNELLEELELIVEHDKNGCYAFNDNTKAFNLTKNSKTSQTIQLDGVGNILTFYYKINSGADWVQYDHHVTTQYSDDGTNFNDISNSRVSTDTKTNTKSHEIQVPQTAKYIRFVWSANGTGSRDIYVSNITVTRAQYIRPTDAGQPLNSTNALVLPPVAINLPRSKPFNLEWSACSDIKITCDNPKFTILTTDISAVSGSQNITITCNTSEIGTFIGDVTIYNQEQKETFPVICEVYTKWLTDSISGSATHSMKVDDSWDTDFYFPIQRASKYPTTDGAFHYAIERTFVDADPADRNPNHPNEVISYNDGVITAHNAGTAILTIKHDETDEHFESQQFTCTLTVSKHDVELQWKDPVYFNDTVYNYFTTTDTISPISIVSETDTDVAKLTKEFNPTSNNSLDLITFNKEASTTVTVSQAENYKWNGYSIPHTITPIDPNNHVPFTIDSQERRDIFDINWNADPYTWDNGIQMGNWLDGGSWADKYVDLHFTGIPDKLTFNTTIKNATNLFDVTDVYWYVKESTDGVNWSGEIWNEKDTKNITITDSIQLNPDSRYLRLCYSGNFGGVFHNIHVTELNQFEAIPDTLNFGQLHVDEPSLTKTFDFKYANAGYKVQFESTDTMFTIATTYIDSIGGEKHGTINGIEVTYHPTHIHNTNTTGAKILIWDEAGHRDTVHLVANTIKSKPTLHWTEAWKADKPIVLLNQTVTNAAESTNGYSTVKYISNKPDIIKVSDDGTSFQGVGLGEAIITAYQDSDRVYEVPDTIQKTFLVTDKLLQYILWEDNLTDFCIGDEQDTLRAQVWVMTDAADGTWEYSPERTAKLRYSSPNENIATVTDSILTIHGIGEMFLNAIVPADNTYEMASAQIPVRVRDCSVQCTDADLIIPVINSDDLIMKPEDKLEYDPYALWGNTEKIVRIDTTAGIPGHLIFAYYGRRAWGTLEGKIRVFESTDGGSNWQQILSDADAVKPLNQQTQYSPYIPLSRNATHIKFERFDGVNFGYHILQYITITPAQYIESIPDDIALGNIYVGNTVHTTVAITYSSIRSNLYLASSYPSHLTIDKTTIEDECGAWDTIPLTITLKADTSVVGPFSQYVTVSDPISGITDTIHITANIVKNTPTITWNTTDTIRSSAEWETKKTAISSSGDQVLYEITQGNQLDEFAYLNDTGKMILLRGGWITARAYTAETTTSNEVSNYHNFFIIVDPLFEDFSNDGNWLNDNNWNIGRTPWATDSATIKANKHVLLTTEIVTEGLRFEAGSSIHITPTGGLSVGARGIQGAATDGSSIIIDNLKTGIGFLRISPAYQGAMPRTTVNYQTRSTLDTGANRDATWQYFGAPGKNVSFTIDYITWLYQWNEKQNWVKQNGTLTFEPFAGYAITQYGQPTYSLVAEPIHTNQTITLTKTPEASGGMNGDNLFANSFMAPIDVKNFTPDDFSDYGTGREDIVKTFYIFNSGSWNQWNGQNEKDSTLGNNGSTTPGQYCAIPALSAQYLDSEYDITTIPPMQGVYVIANENGATIRLDYNKHIWQAGTYTGSSTDMHEPMRAPQRQAQEQMQQDDFRRLRLQVNSANSGADRMYIIQEHTTTRDYDNGYDAPNQFAEGIANIYTTEPFGKMEVSCANNIDSMYIGFQAGTDEQYTLSFRSLIGDSLYLKDLSNDSIFLLTEGGKYHFTAQPLSTNDLRFQVLLHPVFNNEDTNAGVTTDMEYVADTHIWHDHNQLYITNAPANSTLALYNINGQLILSHTTQHTTHTIDLYNLHQGVYILQLNNQMYKFVRQ